MKELEWLRRRLHGHAGAFGSDPTKVGLDYVDARIDDLITELSSPRSTHPDGGNLLQEAVLAKKEINGILDDKSLKTRQAIVGSIVSYFNLVLKQNVAAETKRCADIARKEQKMFDEQAAEYAKTYRSSEQEEALTNRCYAEVAEEIAEAIERGEG